MGDLGLVLLGAALALVGGVVTLVVEKKWEFHQKSRDNLAEKSTLAFATLVKLTEIVATARKIDRAITECVEDADASNMGHLEIGVKVQPLVGAPSVLDRVRTDELALVLETGDTGLVEKILQVQGNFSATLAVIERFNVAREAYSMFVRNNATAGTTAGVAVTMQLDPKLKPQIEAHLAELNQMIGEIIKGVDEDGRAAVDLVVRVQTAYSSLPGLTLHRVSFEKVN